MAQSINLQTPVLGFGSFGVAQCTVQILEGATPITTIVYYFPISHFSSQCDLVNVNIASIHFGDHVLNISNGQFSAWNLDGVSQSSISALVNAFSDIVANLS